MDLHFKYCDFMAVSKTQVNYIWMKTTPPSTRSLIRFHQPYQSFSRFRNIDDYI